MDHSYACHFESGNHDRQYSNYIISSSAFEVIRAHCKSIQIEYIWNIDELHHYVDCVANHTNTLFSLLDQKLQQRSESLVLTEA